RYGTNPTVVDTDGDGLGDGEEVLTYKTDPLVADTDGDTYSDGAEVAAGTNPQDPAEHPSTIPGTVTDTATVDTPTAFIPGFCSVELVFALACLVILARRVTKQ
ncbi:MAG: thrombospondin type 3 repeat-containing protein, partial [bacterium]